jgi:hypothetical protein
MFSASVDFPTPPLPAPTAITFFTCGRTSFFGPWVARVLAVISKLTCVAPAFASAARTSRSMTSFIGQAGVVSSTRRFTLVPATSRFFTIPRVTISL